MQTRAKRCWLRCSNCWEIAVTGNSLKLWSAKRAWCTQKIRRCWTVRCERRTSAICKSSAKPISWEAGSFVAQSIDRSRSQSQFNSWQANARVLLRFLGSVHRPPRLRADSDEHDLCWSAWERRSSRVSRRIRGDREMVASMGKGNAKAAGWLRYVGSATTSLNKTEKKRSSARRVTSLNGSVDIAENRDFVWSTDRCPHMSSRSWAWTRSTTNAGAAKIHFEETFLRSQQQAMNKECKVLPKHLSLWLW